LRRVREREGREGERAERKKGAIACCCSSSSSRLSARPLCHAWSTSSSLTWRGRRRRPCGRRPGGRPRLLWVLVFEGGGEREEREGEELERARGSVLVAHASRSLATGRARRAEISARLEVLATPERVGWAQERRRRGAGGESALPLSLCDQKRTARGADGHGGGGSLERESHLSECVGFGEDGSARLFGCVRVTRAGERAGRRREKRGERERGRAVSSSSSPPLLPPPPPHFAPSLPAPALIGASNQSIDHDAATAEI